MSAPAVVTAAGERSRPGATVAAPRPRTRPRAWRRLSAARTWGGRGRVTVPPGYRRPETGNGPSAGCFGTMDAHREDPRNNPRVTGGTDPMPEAVIVSTARSPIGRAFKGSLVNERPDDITAQIVTAALAQVPQLDPAEIEDLMLGTGSPAGEHGFNAARVVAVMAGLDTVPGVTVNRYCSSSLQTIRMAAHAIRAGEGHAFMAAGVEFVSRYPNGASDNGDAVNPVFGEAQARSAQRSGGRLRDVDTAPGPARRLHRHGPDGRERGPAGEREPGRAGRLGRPQPEPGRGGDQAGVLRARHHPRDPAGRHHPQPPTTAPGPAPRWRRWPAWSRCSGPTARSPPATPAPSTTGRRRWW